MSNKTQLQTNNTALDALITRVNAAKDTAASLPDVGDGSGGSIETYSGNLGALTMPDLSALTVIYTDKNLITQSIVPSSGNFSFEVIKNSIVYISGGSCNAVSGCEKLGGGFGAYAYKITANNFSLTYAM